jgi:hypothetical protein
MSTVAHVRYICQTSMFLADFVHAQNPSRYGRLARRPGEVPLNGMEKSFEPARSSRSGTPAGKPAATSSRRAMASPTASCCRRRTSPARCTWAMRSSTPIMDALIRYQRMRGFDTLWQVGTDHAGIATQNGGRASSPPKARRATTSAAKRSSNACGSGRKNPAAPSPPDAPPGRLGATGARALHHGRRPVARGRRGVRAPVSRRPDLSRPSAW